jgi:hypothetical protein
MMQQADHQRRLMQQNETGLSIDESGAVTTGEKSTAAGVDVAVIVVMAVSGLAFLIVCRLRGASPRQLIGRRRIRHDYPSKNLDSPGENGPQRPCNQRPAACR